MASVVSRILNARKAQPPVSYAAAPGALFNLAKSGSPTERNLKAVSQAGTVYQAVYTMAAAVANAEWSLIRTPKPSDDPEAPPERVFVHPALNLLQNPNPFMTGHELLETCQVYFELTGEAYLYIVKNGGMPIEIWPLKPTDIKPIVDAPTFLKGWTYTDENGNEKTLPLEDVIQIRTPNPNDMYRGLSPLPALMADIESLRFAGEYNRNYFLNSAEPRGLLELPRKMKDEEIDRAQRRWHESLRGVQNANRVAVVEEGTKYTNLDTTFKDMQFAEGRELARDIIREGFGVSKTLLGVSESVNRATAEAAEYVFAKHKRNPRLRRWQHALNTHFLPMFGSSGKGVMFVFEEDIPEDENAELMAKTQGALNLANAGYDRSDICRVVGLPQMALAPVKEANPSASPKKSNVPAEDGTEDEEYSNDA